MFDRLATLAHGVRVFVEALLDRLQLHLPATLAVEPNGLAGDPRELACDSDREFDSLCFAPLSAGGAGQLPELKRVIAAYGDHVVMKETLAEALSALFEAGAVPAIPSASTGTPLAGPAANRAREALDRYHQAIERLKSGDWAGFGTELDAMRGLLEDMRRQSDDH
jgi:hypothetical protein